MSWVEIIYFLNIKILILYHKPSCCHCIHIAIILKFVADKFQPLCCKQTAVARRLTRLILLPSVQVLQLRIYMPFKLVFSPSFYHVYCGFDCESKHDLDFFRLFLLFFIRQKLVPCRFLVPEISSMYINVLQDLGKRKTLGSIGLYCHRHKHVVLGKCMTGNLM